MSVIRFCQISDLEILFFLFQEEYFVKELIPVLCGDQISNASTDVKYV